MIYTDGQTDMTKLLGSFRNYANATIMADIYKYQGWDSYKPVVTIRTTLFKIKKLNIYIYILYESLRINRYYFKDN